MEAKTPLKTVNLHKQIRSLTVTQTGSIPVQLRLETETDFASAVIAHSEDASTTFEAAFDKNENLHIDVASKGAFFSRDRKGGFVLVVRVPRDLEHLDVSGNAGGVYVNGPNVSGSIKVTLGAGEVQFRSPILCESFDVSAKAGAVNLSNVTVSGAVAVSSYAGEVKGSVSGYTSLRADAKMGSLDLQLAPAPGAQTTLEAKMGELKVQVSKFQGRFRVGAKMGDVKVSGPDSYQASNPCTGYVGTELQKGLGVEDVSFIASVGMGSAKVEFL